jgi:hypothetical protein
MPGQFNLDKGGSVGRDEYTKLLAEAMKRYGGDRDRAVRDANVAGGFGNSTAQRFMHGGGAPAAGGGGSSGPASGAPMPQQRPQQLSGPESGVPMPMPRDFGSPDLAVSPPHGDMMWPGATDSGAMAGTAMPQNAVQANPAMSMASILRGVPPELLGSGGFPPFKPGLGFLMDVPPDLTGGVRPTSFGGGNPRPGGGNNGGYPLAGVRG